MNQLKEAERKATELVYNARKARGDKMKEAKTEADKIIAAYRSEMEADYQASLANVSSKSGATNSQLEESTERDIDSMREEFSARKGAVKRMLVDLVLKVNTALPTSQY